ncbi:MAG: hypothetical protein HY748_09080 [Elusimicrobia bacterium]|nr:hypothetical protein [Elusimicrobiota bacterium]
MDKSLEDLRQALKKLRQDIESQAGVTRTASAPADVPCEAQPQDREAAPAAADGVRAASHSSEKLVAPDRPAAEILVGEPGPREPAGDPQAGDPQAAASPIWPKALAALGLGVAAGGAFVGSGPALGAGLVVCLVGVIAGAFSPASASAGLDEEVRDISLRVAALERRVSTGSRAAESGAVSREIVEEIVELRRILTTLFRALGKPPETQ